MWRAVRAEDGALRVGKLAERYNQRNVNDGFFLVKPVLPLRRVSSVSLLEWYNCIISLVNVRVKFPGTWKGGAMTERVRVRRAVEADAPRLQRYVAELFGEKLPVLFVRDRVPSVDDERRYIEEMTQSERSLLLVAEVDGDIVGMLDFHGHKEPQRAHAGELGISTAKGWRGRGVGTKLLGHLLEWAAARDFRRIELRVFSNNEGAIRLYERFGFVVEGRQVEAVKVGDGFVDIVYMAKFM